VGARERLTDPCELVVEAIFELTVPISHSQVINRLLYYRPSSNGVKAPRGLLGF
jgi:hypothetical protein